LLDNFSVLTLVDHPIFPQDYFHPKPTANIHRRASLRNWVSMDGMAGTVSWAASTAAFGIFNRPGKKYFSI